MIAGLEESCANGLMNRKLPPVSVVPEVMLEYVNPPLVERAIERPVFSTQTMLVFAGLTATYPPSPPRKLVHAFLPPATPPFGVPLSWVPPKNAELSGNATP